MQTIPRRNGLRSLQATVQQFATPVGTRSIGYLTKLLKPKFDTNNLEESFSTWEFELHATSMTTTPNYQTK